MFLASEETTISTYLDPLAYNEDQGEMEDANPSPSSQQPSDRGSREAVAGRTRGLYDDRPSTHGASTPPQ